MEDGLGSGCISRGVTPASGIWDYYRTAGQIGETISVAVFQWISTTDGSGVIRGRVSKRYRGKLVGLDSLVQKAEALCQKLESQTEVVNYDDPRVRINAASAANASTETLASLSDDVEVQVRLRVARHRNTDSSTLEKLSGDPVPDVRAAVARNPNTSGQVRAALTKDKVGTVTTAARQAISFANRTR